MNKFIRYIIVSCLLTCWLPSRSAGNAAIQTIGLSIQGTTVLEKNTFTIAIKADTDLTGEEVFSYRFGISYNANYLEFLSIDSVGPVLKNWGLPTYSNKTKGKISIAGAGTAALSGTGNLIYLKFKALRGGGTYISNIAAESYLNEGAPAMTLANGYINATNRSYPVLHLNKYQLFVGEEAQMSVNGGTAPYVYSVENTNIAVISEQTKLKAVSPGLTRAFVTDKDGEVGYFSNSIDVRAVKLTVMSSNAWPGENFQIPVKIEIAPGTTVYSGYFELSYNSNIQGITQNVSNADFSVTLESNSTASTTRVSFASAQGISGTGILCYLGFKAINSGKHNLTFQNTQINENLRTFNYGTFAEIFQLPTLNISPNSGTLMWGATQKITVTNGTPPLTYKVSNPALATIDELGNLNAISGGFVRVTATDTHGATKTSGDFKILDNQFSVINTDGDLDFVTRVPISTSQLPAGKAVYDFDGIISFVENDLEFVGLDPANSGMLTEYVKTGNSVHIVGASTSGITSGIICYLKFRIKNSMAIDAVTPITIQSLTGNESTLFSTTANGQVKRVFQLTYRPVAHAGINKSVAEGTVVQLDGSGSYDNDGDPITYKWTPPAGITLDNNSLQKPSFTAPEVNVNTIYNFTLVVNDGKSDSDPASVAITVLHINKRPVANAGPDKSYNEGSSVSLSGLLSSDPDNDVISYKWTSLDGIILFDANGSSPSFNAPQVNADKIYRFKLEVSDGVLTSLPDTVNITILNLNKKPLAFAGGDQTVNEGTLVQLDGSLSSDADGETLSYKWTAPPNVILSSYTVAKPSFTAPMVKLDSVVVITLVVNDGHVDSDPDQVSITIKNLNILSSEAQIISAAQSGADSVKVNQSLLQVTLYMPYGTDVRSLAPTFQISPKAGISPVGGTVRNFTSPVNYTVTAEDTETKKTYSVRVFVPSITLKRTLAAGWNWISLSAMPGDLKTGSVLGGLNSSNLDYIKASTSSAVFYSPATWFGDLVNLPQYEMLMLKKATSEVFTLTGQQINPTLVSIPVISGWNRIGYILKGNAALASAFDPASLPSGEILLKSKEASAIYYPSSGWTGDLDSLRVLSGYMMKSAGAGNLKYMASAARLKSAGQTYASAKSLYEAYRIDPATYEFSANLIGELTGSLQENKVNAGDLLLAYSGNEVRGVTEARFVPELNRHIFILTLFSNQAEEKLSFRIKPANEEFELQLTEELNFANNEVFGAAMTPFALHLQNATQVSDDDLERSVSVFPNPAYNELQIKSTAKIRKVTISAISGNNVFISGNVPEVDLTLHIGHLATGMYLLKVETDRGTLIRKLIKSTR